MKLSDFKDLRIFGWIFNLLLSYKLGIIPIIIFLISGFVRFYYQTNISHLLLAILVIILEILRIGYWLYKYYYFDLKRKNRKVNKLNIVVCINTEFEYEKYLLKSDFVKELKKNIDPNKFEITILHQKYFHHLFENQKKKKFNLKYITELNKKIKGHYWICGSVDKQKDDGYKCFIETSALVFHKEVDPKLNHEFGKEFFNVYEKNFNFLDERYKSGIVFSGEYSMIVALYIIGLASLISNDPFTAWELHKDLYENMAEIKEKMMKLTSKDESIYRGMINNIKHIQWLELKVISEILYLSQLSIGLPTIDNTGNNKWIDEWSHWIDLREEKSKQFNDPKMMCGVYANRAILYFLKGRDITKSRSYMKKSMSGNSSREYSIIFLDLYDKKYELAKQRIKKILDTRHKKLSDAQFVEIDLFINSILKIETGHEELLYWMSVLYYQEGYINDAIEFINQYLEWSKGEIRLYEVIPADKMKTMLANLIK